MKKQLNKKTRQLLDKAEKAERFPYCVGSFDTCPVRQGKKIDPHNPPVECRKCPIFADSRYYKPARPELDEFAKMVFSKN